MKRLPVRLDTSASDILEKIAAERGISLSKAVNEIILEYGKEKKEAADIRAAVAAARGAEEQGRINQEILNSMLLGFSSFTETKYQPHKVHPIVEGARKADAQMRIDRMKGKTV